MKQIEKLKLIKALNSMQKERIGERRMDRAMKLDQKRRKEVELKGAKSKNFGDMGNTQFLNAVYGKAGDTFVMDKSFRPLAGSLSRSKSEQVQRNVSFSIL
jgi:hypothetical protein